MKKILVDINHPAHVHLFRYFIGEMKAAGHEVFVLAKNVESITGLLTRYHIPFITTGRKKDGMIGKVLFGVFSPHAGVMAGYYRTYRVRHWHLNGAASRVESNGYDIPLPWMMMIWWLRPYSGNSFRGLT